MISSLFELATEVAQLRRDNRALRATNQSLARHVRVVCGRLVDREAAIREASLRCDRIVAREMNAANVELNAEPFGTPARMTGAEMIAAAYKQRLGTLPRTNLGAW